MHRCLAVSTHRAFASGFASGGSCSRSAHRVTLPILRGPWAPVLAVPRRYCCYQKQKQATSALSDAAPPATHASDRAVDATEASLDEQIKRLSPEDQKLIHAALTDPKSLKPSVMGGPGIGPKGGDMLATFTCGQCDHRMVKRFTRHAYTKGIVIVECAGCRARHLIADNLGWLEDEAKNIEDILTEKGESFVRLGDPGSAVFEVRPPE